MKHVIMTLCTLLLYVSSSAQIAIPSASPLTTIQQKVGVTEISLSYSRPSVKDRIIFSKDGLVPFGDYWRTGANNPTTISITDDIIIAGQNLEKGEYVILSKPEESTWQVFLYPKSKGGWNKYIDREAKLVIEVEPENSPSKMESLLIYFDNIKQTSVDLVMHWDQLKWSIPIEVLVHDKVMANINKVMNGPSDFEYFRAASYMYSVDEQLELALEYIQKASNGERPTFFFSRREATILAKLGKYKEAIKAAQRSNELAQDVGNIDVIKLNDKSIKEWTDKL